MSQHILLIQEDARGARAIVKALSHTSDESFDVEWVRHCSELLDRLEAALGPAIEEQVYIDEINGPSPEVKTALS